MEDIDTRRKTVGERAGKAAWLELARIARRAPSRVKMRLPLTPRHATESGAPVIACYVFENAGVCLEIRGDNR